MDWGDYVGLDDSPSITITVSDRTLALIMSAMFYIEAPRAWGDYNANGDDINAAIGDAYTELNT